MAQGISLQQAGERWVRNSIQANPDRIYGIVRAYFSGRQPLRWVVGLLQSEEASVVFPIVNVYKVTHPLKHSELMFYLQNIRAMTVALGKSNAPVGAVVSAVRT